MFRMLAGVVTFFLALGCAAALAQPYPSKPIRVVVGGSPEAVPRILGEKMAERLGQQFIVDQRGGAGGSIAAEIVARAANDGYTLLLCTSAHMMLPNFYKVSYDMVKDFAPVAEVASTFFVLTVNPSLPAKSVKELIELAKAKPGELNFGSAGNGSAPHLIGEMFRLKTGVNIVHVPYKTTAEAVTDLMGRQIQIMFTVSTAAVPQMTAGRIRGLAVTSLKRSSIVADLPTLDEQGVRGFEATAWYGYIAPANTAARVVDTLHREIARAVALPDVTQRLANLGLEPAVTSPQEFRAFIKAELVKWAKVAQESGAKSR